MRRQAADSTFFLAAAGAFAALVSWPSHRSPTSDGCCKAPTCRCCSRCMPPVMTGWVLLFALQTVLVEKGRIGLHRRLGKIGAGWAVLVVILGCVTTLHASAREVREHTEFASLQLTITGLELTEMSLFAGFVAAAVWLRRRGDYHKRLMLLTLVCMLPSVLPRLPLATSRACFPSCWVSMPLWSCVSGSTSCGTGGCIPPSRPAASSSRPHFWWPSSGHKPRSGTLGYRE